MSFFGKILQSIPRAGAMILLLALAGRAADYFWVGGTGNWSDLNHWATASGGSTHPGGPPTASDNCLFDANSFSSSSQTVTIDVNANCADMNWTGANFTPGFTGSFSYTLRIYGSLTYITAMNYSVTCNVYLQSTSTGKTVTTGARQFNNILFDGVGGSWTLQDSLKVTTTLTLTNGTLNTNNQTLIVNQFSSNGTSTRALNMGSTFFKSNNSGSPWLINPVGFTLNSGTSTISYNGINGFGGGGLTYYDLVFTQVSTSGAGISGNNSFHSVTFLGDANISGSNTFQNLSMAPGKTYTFTASTTQTITGTLAATGGCDGQIYFRSSSAGNPATISKASGSVDLDYVAVKDMVAAGGATYTVNHAIDQGGNSGWTLNARSPQNLFWIGNSGNWGDGSHWSATSGGSASSCTPTQLDNAYFDNNSFSSPSQTVTMNLTSGPVKDLDWTGVNYAPTFAGSSSNTLQVHGSLTLVSGMTQSFQGMVNFAATTTGKTVTMATKTLTGGVSFQGAGGGWTLQDAFTTTGGISLLAGTLSTNGQAVSTYGFSSSGTPTRVLNLGASSITITSGTWNISGAQLTLNSGTSTLNFSGSGTLNFSGGDFAYYDFNCPSAATIILTGNNSFHDASFSANASLIGNNSFHDITLAAGTTFSLADAKTQTLSGALNATGSCAGLVTIASGGTGTTSTLSKSSGAITISNVSLQNVAAVGGATFTANNSVDLGGNSGWTINALSSQELYWISNSGNWNDGSHWATSSGGASSGCVPAPVDNVHFDGNSFNTSGRQVTVNVPATFRDMIWTGVNYTPTLSSSYQLKSTGSLTLVSGMTFTANGGISFEATTSGKTITLAGKTVASSVTFAGAGGGWTLQDNLTTTGGITHSAGTLNTNGMTVSAQNFTISGSAGKTLTLGASAINLSSGQWNYSGSGLTLNSGTSVITLNYGFGNTFYGGGATYYDLVFSGGSNYAAIIYNDNVFHDFTTSISATFQGDNSFNNLTVSAGKTLTLASGKTQTLSGTLTATGACSGTIILQSSAPGSQATVSKSSGSVTIDRVSLRDINATGGATFTANNSVDVAGNSGWTINALTPTTLYWIGNGGLWHGTSKWSLTSGGSSSGCIPSPVDDVVFDANSFSSAGQTVDLNTHTVVCKNMTWTGVTNNPTISTSNSTNLKIHGSLTLSSGMTWNHYGALEFEGSGTGKTITFAGRSMITGGLYFNGNGGEWILQDSLKGVATLNLNAGTLRTNNQTVALNHFYSVGSAARSLYLGSSVVKFDNNYANWSVTGTGLTLDPGTSKLVFPKPATFAGGGKTYYDVDFLNGSLDTLTTISGSSAFNNVLLNPSTNITGSNSFANLTLNPGRTYTLTAGTTQTISAGGRLFATGAAGNLITIRSATAGTPATIAKSAGPICLDYVSLKDLTASGGAAFNSGSTSHSVDVSGNSGWSFTGGCTNPSPTDVVWDGGGADTKWTTAGNWVGDTLPAAASHVIFDGTSVKNCLLDADVSVKSVAFLTGYSGTFSFSTHALTLTEDADFRNIGGITAATGTLGFAGSTQTLYPKNGTTLPNILLSGSGTTTITGAAMTAGDLQISGGALVLGAGMTHEVAGVSGSGSLDFATSDLRATGDVDLSALTVVANNANTLVFANTANHTFTPKSALSTLKLSQVGSGTTLVAGYNITSPSLNIADGSFYLGTGRTHAFAAFTSSGGTLDFGTSTFGYSGATLDFTPLAGINAPNGVLALTATTGTQTITPKTLNPLPVVAKSGGGTVLIATNPLIADSLAVGGGVWDWGGASLVHSVRAITTVGSATMTFGSNTVKITTGRCDLSGLGTLNAGTGTLQFMGGGNQLLTPKAGSAHPAITKTGSGTLSLAAAFTCAAYSQTGGKLDAGFNSFTTTGDFSATGIGGRAFDNLGGTITVGGNFNVTGQSAANRLTMAGTAWNLNATGTVSASLADIRRSTASGTAGTCVNCTDSTGNSGWTFLLKWDGGGNDANWNTAANWGLDAVPTSADNVVFDAGNMPVLLNVSASVSSLKLASGYSGDFNFGSQSVLIYGGSADFRTGGTITHGSGLVYFMGGGNQTLIPPAADTLPNLQRTNSGTVTITTYPFVGNDVILPAGGALNLGAGLNHVINGFTSNGVAGGTLNFGTSNLSAKSGVDFHLITVVTPGTNTLTFSSPSTQQYYQPNAANTGLILVQAGAGTTTVATTNITTPSLTLSAGTFQLGAGRIHSAAALTVSGGTLDFGSSSLNVAGNVDLSASAGLTPGTGALIFNGGSAQTFKPKAGFPCPAIVQQGSVSTTLIANPMVAAQVDVQSGALILGTSLSHSATSLISSGGAIDFGNGGSLAITAGNADLSGLASVVAGTGTLSFTAGSGSQVLTPRNSDTLPAISHTGADTLRIAVNPLVCNAFSQSAGTFDLNMLDVATVSGGSFSISNGNSASFTNLAGRTLMVSGNASLTGATSASPLNLDPASAWTLGVTGSLNAAFAALARNTASLSTGECLNCAVGTANVNWAFEMNWDGGGSDSNWTTAANWGADALPNSATAVVFNTGSKGVKLDANAAVKTLTMTGGWSGDFNFTNKTLTISGNSDFRSSGTLTPGTGLLEFSGASGTQTFIPMNGAVFPDLLKTGGGTTLITTYGLNGGSLTLSGGSVDLGAALNHSIKSISGSASIALNSAQVTLAGDVDFSGLSGYTESSASKLTFAPGSSAAYTPYAGANLVKISKANAGALLLAANVTTPLLTVSSGSIQFGTGRTHSIGSMTLTGGALDFGSSLVHYGGSTADFTNLSSIIPGSGTLDFTSASQVAFTPKASLNFPQISLNGTGGAALGGDLVSAGTLTQNDGALALGSGRTHTVAGYVSGGGTLDFGSSSLHVTGSTASFAGLATLTRGAGILFLEAVSGTQTLTPKSGAAHPPVIHSTGSTLTLGNYDLAAASLLHSAGVLDLNGHDITLSGNLDISAPGASLSGLGGRTLTVGGNAALSGASGNLLAASPNSRWTLAVNGSLTASYASIRHCSTSVSAGAASNSADLGDNTVWTFSVAWTGAANDGLWSTGNNWGSGIMPTAATDVIFDATSTSDVHLDQSAAVKSLALAPAYTGVFDFGSNTLAVSGTADLRGASDFTFGLSGLLDLTGASGQSFYPHATKSLPAVSQSGTGGTTLMSDGRIGNLLISTGAFNLGTGRILMVEDLSGFGTLVFNTGTLRVNGDADFTDMTGMTPGTGELAFTGSSPQIFLPGGYSTFPDLRQNGSGGTTVSNQAFGTPALRIDNGIFHLGTSGQTITVGATFQATGGGLDFGTGTLRVAAAAIDLAPLATLTPGTGTLELAGADGQTLAPKAGAPAPSLRRNASGTATLINGGWNGGTLSVPSGTLNLGSSLFHTFAAVASPGAGSLDFGGSDIIVSGDADFSGLVAVSGGNTLTFSAISGTQVFTPKSGATFPTVRHTGAGTLVLSTNHLLCASFMQSQGAIDFSGRNLTVASGGGFNLTGGSASLVGLGGSILTVGGNASFMGQPASRLPMNPGLSWTLAVTGTLKAVNADLRNCQATGSAGVADSSRDLGGNANWTFIDTVPPAGVTGFIATALNGHAVQLAWTAPADADADSVMLRVRNDGSYPANHTDGTLLRMVPKSRTSDTATGVPDKTVFHAAAFVRDSAGNWSAAASPARDTARTPDVTPPANVTALSATAFSAGSVALTWTPSASADADSVRIRYRIGTGYPAGSNDGTFWRTLSHARATDTLTGLTANTIYAVGLFVRDSSGNFSAPATAAQDSALWQNPVSGSVAFLDAAGKTANPVPRFTLAASGADSVRFSLLADTGSAVWMPLHGADSVNAAPGQDGKRIAAAQFKNTFGTRSPWYRDTTLLDRFMPAPILGLAGAYGYLTWPNAISGKVVDSIAGTDTVFVLRQRESDNAWFNGSTWAGTPDTARIRADSTFSVPLASAALASGFYNLTAWGKDKLGNVSAPVTARVRFDANRAPQPAADSVRDSVLQNQSVSWILDLGDVDIGDTVTTVTAAVPAWLARTEAPDSARGGFTAHRVYTFAGKPGQAEVGSHQLTLQAKDVGGQTFTWSRTVKVVDVNDPPIFAIGQDSLSIKEDSTTRFIVKAIDPDPQDKPVFSLASGPAWATLADSTLTMAPGSRDVGPAMIRLIASDGRLLDTLDIKVTVLNVNDAPVAFPAGVWPSSMRWNEDIVDTFSVVVVDMDRNDNVALSGSLPTFLSFQVAMDSTGYNRTFRFTAKPAQQDAGSYNLKLRFQDKAGAFSELPLRAVVNAVNDAPLAAIQEIEVSGGAARAGLDAQDPDGSLAQTRFHYRLIAANGDTVRSGICAAPPLYLHPLADGAYKLAVAAEDESGLKQSAYAVAPFTITGASAIALDSARWHMIAFPGRALPASALGAGASAATWDEAAADGSPLGRYATGKAADSLLRGKGYWARTAKPVTLSAPLSDLLDKPFTLKLSRGKQGWNQIGNPYPYSVDLSATGLTFWEWDGERRDLVNARGLLKPWAAYWVQVAKDTVLTIKPEPWFPAKGGKTQGAALAKAAWNHGSDWTLQLSLSAGPYRDAANFLGIKPVTPSAPPGSRAGTIADAPKFGDYIALHFDAPEAAQGFAADIRPALDADEEWWDFSLENSGTGLGQASLELLGLDGLTAAGLYAFVVRQGEAVLVEPGIPAALSMEGPATRYSLVVTPHADFASRLKGSFSLSQNYPNPVAGATTFRFFLPQAWGKDGKRLASGYQVRLNVYDYSGRQVARVAEGMFKPGSHALIWQARGQSGQSLASGNYVYRLEAPGFVKSLKLLVK